MGARRKGRHAPTARPAQDEPGEPGRPRHPRRCAEGAQRRPTERKGGGPTAGSAPAEPNRGLGPAGGLFRDLRAPTVQDLGAGQRRAMQGADTAWATHSLLRADCRRRRSTPWNSRQEGTTARLRQARSHDTVHKVLRPKLRPGPNRPDPTPGPGRAEKGEGGPRHLTSLGTDRGPRLAQYWPFYRFASLTFYSCRGVLTPVW